MPPFATAEPTLHDVLQAILVIDVRTQKMDGTIKQLERTVQSLDERQTETLEAIHAFSSDVDARFNQVDQRFEQIDRRFEHIDMRMNGMDKRLNGIETRMVTKEYLDDELFALRADLIQLAKRADKRLDQLIEELVSEKSLKRATADRLLAMGS